MTLLCLSCRAGQPARDATPAEPATEQAEPPRSEAKTKSAKPANSSSAKQNADERFFLSRLSVVASQRATHALANATDDHQFASELEIRIQVMRGYKDYAELTKRSKSRVADGFVEIAELSSLQGQDKPVAEHTKSSFVVDYDEPAVRSLSELLVSPAAAPSIASIEGFVSDYIEQKTYVRAFDVASRVARSKAGDCTEHAVLTAALLRSIGKPARIVFGIVLVGIRPRQAAPGIMAAGHAWVEAYHQDSWHIVDAALHVPEDSSGAGVVGVPGLPDGIVLRRAYLPINVLKNESPGYARALMDEAGVEGVLRVFVDARPSDEQSLLAL